MKRLVAYIGCVIIGAVFISVFVAYFITGVDPVSHTMYDGFGRPLSVSPWVVRFLFGQERLWAGWGWFIADMILFWGGLGVGFSLVRYGFNNNSNG